MDNDFFQVESDIWCFLQMMIMRMTSKAQGEALSLYKELNWDKYWLRNWFRTCKCLLFCKKIEKKRIFCSRSLTKSPHTFSKSEQRSEQNGSIAEEIDEEIEDISIEADDLLRSERSGVRKQCCLIIVLVFAESWCFDRIE